MSTKYAALLRGINVGGNRKVPMLQLRDVATSLGLGDVSTYINSGNLLFTSDSEPDALTEALHAALIDRFGFAVDVVVVSATELNRVLEQCPFDGDPKQVNVTFRSAPLDETARAALRDLAVATERIDCGPADSRVMYIDFGGGLARSKLANKIHAVSTQGYATTRNIRTVATLVGLLNEMS